MNDITPIYYLNRRIKPNSNNFYSVYLRFNHNGTNYRLKSQLIDYMVNEHFIPNYKSVTDIETKYINTLIDYSKYDYTFSFYKEDIELLNTNLLDLFINENLSFNKIDFKNIDKIQISKEFKKKLLNYKKPSSIYNSEFREEIITHISKNTKLHSKFLDQIITKDIFSKYLWINPLITEDNKSLYNYIKILNILFAYKYNIDESNSNIDEFDTNMNFLINNLNIYQWVFENKGLEFKEKYGDHYYNIVNEFVTIQCFNIFLVENIYETLKNNKKGIK